MAATVTTPVEFDGGDAGEVGITWGQRAIWESMRWLGDRSHYFNISRVLPVPAVRSLAGLRTALGTLVARHQALRTTFPGYPEDPRQRVHRAGTLELVVVDVAKDAAAEVGDGAGGTAAALTGSPPGDGADGATEAAAEQLCRELTGRPFRHEREFPLRAGVVTAHGRPRRLVLVVSHLGVDGTGMELLRTELAGLLDGRPPDPGPAPTSLALAATETGEAGEAASRKAMRHWRTSLNTGPPSMFDFAQTTPESPRFCGLTLESSALRVAVDRIAHRLRSTTSTVFLAAAAAVLAHYTGHEQVSMQLIASNRWRPRLERALLPLAQNAIFTMPTAGLSFEDAVRVAGRQSLASYYAGAYDPRHLRAELDSARVRLGAHPDREALFNDVRRGDHGGRLPAARPHRPDELEELRERTRIAVTHRWETLALKTFFYVRGAGDRATVHLQVDTAYLPAQTARALLAGMEALVVRASHTPVGLDALGELSGVAPVGRGPDWVRIGPGWVRLPAVTALLRGSELVTDAIVVREPVPGAADPEPRLVAYVAPAEPGLTVAALHADVCRSLGERTDVRAPGHYVICATAPPAGTGDDPETWRGLPVRRAGSGRPPA